MSKTTGQIGKPEGYAARDPESFDNPGQKTQDYGGTPKTPVNAATRGMPVENGTNNTSPAGGAIDVRHQPTPVVGEGWPNLYKRHLAGGNPKLPEAKPGKE